jgi:hypothetical protein
MLYKEVAKLMFSMELRILSMFCHIINADFVKMPFFLT